MALIAADANPGLDDFFTVESLATFQGATAAIVLVVNTLGYLIGERFDKARKWVAFVLALGLEVVLALAADTSGVGPWVVAALNALLIFAAAMGINQGAEHLLGRGDRDRQAGLRFFRSWLR
jgi:hypothetical protein